MRDRSAERLEEDMAEELQDEFEDALSGFVRVGLTAVRVVVDQIIGCVQEKLLSKLFTKEW